MKSRVFPAAAGYAAPRDRSSRWERITNFEFLRGYVVTMRPYLLFVSGITGVAGLSFAPDGTIWSTLCLALVFFLSYGFGQALTDCFQLDTDSLSAPYRPLVKGTIRRDDVMTVSVIGLTVIGVVVALYSYLNILLAGLTVVGVATYTPLKRRWWGGPLYNAGIVTMLFLIGFVSGMGAGSVGSWSLAATGAAFATFFGYANFVLTGYYKDISADRATGYRTLPVVFGMRTATVVSDALALLTLAGCGVAIYATLSDGTFHIGQGPSFMLLVGGVVATVVAQARLHTVREESVAHRAIGPVVHAYILLLSAIAALQKPSWAPAVVLLYAGFVVAMKLRPMKQQI